ncbi:hypothetical protein [Luteimonas aquatica]|uniref:hypothetical protein n=1 Tax=Luteimonas aquatica TaxID=450364 RepID=UPI001F56CECE|nr:hypothetical protein [Luteimonas aquatica]
MRHEFGFLEDHDQRGIGQQLVQAVQGFVDRRLQCDQQRARRGRPHLLAVDGDRIGDQRHLRAGIGERRAEAVAHLALARQQGHADGAVLIHRRAAAA